MSVEQYEILPITAEEDLVRVRRATRVLCIKLGFNLVEQTKMITAASELARNTLVFGGGGEVQIQVLLEPGRAGLRLIFEDNGPGIPNIELAMKDGYTTGNGLGLGLSGSKRLVNEFDISSQIGEGTRVSITRWKSNIT
jgi:serine/threonine-protein kinase RsbT